MSDRLTTQVQGTLETNIYNQVKSLNIGISDSVLRGIVSKVASQAASETVTSVNSTANSEMVNIPKNLVGIKNPVNITTGNNSSNQIANNLNNIVDTQVSPSVTNNMVSSLQNELVQSVPLNQRNTLDLNNIETVLTNSLSPSVSKVVSTALKGFTSDVFSRGYTPSPILPGTDKFFASSESPEIALERIDNVYAQSTANKYLQQSKEFNVLSESNQEKLKVLQQGFTDPDANYPTKEYAGRSDTNKLATGDVQGTIVLDKNKNKMIGAKLPGSSSWDEPDSAYRGEYPYNKVTQTESGHIIEIDDTPGAERIHIYHRAGTYVEIDSNGSIIKRTKGSSYEIIDRNGKISIAGKADISINGACNIYVGNDANIEVEGDTNLTCYNDITAQAAGNFNLSAKENFNIAAENVNVQAYSNFNLTSNVSLKMHSSNVINMHSNSEISLQAVNYYNKVSENVYLEAGGDVHQKAGDDMFQSTGGDYHLKTGGTINEDSGGLTYINSDTSISASESKDSSIAGTSEIGVLSARKDVIPIIISDPQALTLADSYTLDNEEGKQDIKELKTHADKLLKAGVASSSELNQVPIVQGSSSVESSQTIIVAGSQDLLKVTSLPGNFNLSPNFTIEMVSSKAAVTRDVIETSELTYGQIAFNLQQVALNVLEPVYNLYPNAFVTSGYRQRAKSSKTSQHPLGQAVDIQFKGVAKSEYYEIAKKLAKVLKYDQLLLEFCAYTNNPWIHISYTGKQERLQVATFWNHTKHSDGLTLLG